LTALVAGNGLLFYRPESWKAAEAKARAEAAKRAAVKAKAEADAALANIAVEASERKHLRAKLLQATAEAERAPERGRSTRR
jgi:hypothetical protein